MTAGLTKVYACLTDEFVIYDSRVGAALGLLARTFATETELDDPDLDPIRFPWGSGNTSSKTANRRNPSALPYSFPKYKNERMHAEWNLRASWLLSQVATDLDLAVAPGVPPLRQLEAGLFMIGYSVRG